MSNRTYKTTAAQAVGELTAWAIANLVEANTGNDEATAYWENIRDDLAEAIDYADGERPNEDRLAEIADGAPDIYNYTRMMEAIGTGAYLDQSDLATGNEDMVTLAGYVLYEQASAVIAAILDEVAL